ncbi:MAG: lysophospholipid acyltransferase family protein [Actinomycetota bacterium]|nr:lysophospholipid acyltransferase family protein [Actinomycetota bacterium]
MTSDESIRQDDGVKDAEGGKMVQSASRHHLIRPYEDFFDRPLKGPERGVRIFPWIAYVLVTIYLKVFHRVRVEGRENLGLLPKGTAAIVSGNHTSYLDPVLLVWAFKLNIRFIAKEELFEHRVLRGLLARLGSFPIKRETADRSAIRRSLASLARGEHLGIFPEGTRIRHEGQVPTYHAGVALIARMAKVPVIPVGIQGADRVKPVGSKLFRFPKIVIRIGKPVWCEEFDSYPRKQRGEIMTDELMAMSYALRDGVPFERVGQDGGTDGGTHA